MIDLIQKYAQADSAVKLATRLEELIREERLAPGALLPPVRELAKATGVSPNTAAAAIKALVRRGVVMTDGRRGTRVQPRPSQREYVEPPARAGALDLRVANPDPALLPDLRRLLAKLPADAGTYDVPNPHPELAEVMRHQFEQERQPPGQLSVFGGALPALYRALQAWGQPGDKVAVEDPGFNEHHGCVAALGRVALPLQLDAEGVTPPSLRAALRAGATAVLLTPRLHSPTGARWSKGRAAQLREILEGSPEVGVAIDDYAALLADEPLPPVFPRTVRRFLLARSFNKPLGPELRVAVGLADPETAAQMERSQWLSSGRVSAYAQRLAAAALQDRQVSAQLARARAVYRERRETLVAALARHGVAAQGQSGLHVWVPVTDEATVVSGLQARGFYVRSGARYRLASPPGVRITISRLMPKEAGRLAEELAAIVRPGHHRGP